MKIQLDYEIKIEVKEGNKVKEKLTIFYREFTKVEQKEQETLSKQFQKIFKKAQKIERKQNSLTKKAELFELNKDYEKALKAISEREELEEDSDSLMDELNEIGGGDQNVFLETTAAKRFETLVSGKDKEKLYAIGEVKGFVALMRNLDATKAELEKKQSGE
ncbi:MAG: hypothetical protein QM497_04925 [Sulfurimonas sp.]